MTLTIQKILFSGIKEIKKSGKSNMFFKKYLLLHNKSNQNIIKIFKIWYNKSIHYGIHVHIH